MHGSHSRKQMSRLDRMLKSFTKVAAALSPNCKQASRLQSEALDHSLPLCKRIGLRIHLLLCHWCRRYGKQIRFLREAVRQRPEAFEEPAAEKLPEAIRERTKQRLNSKG